MHCKGLGGHHSTLSQMVVPTDSVNPGFGRHAHISGLIAREKTIAIKHKLYIHEPKREENPPYRPCSWRANSLSSKIRSSLQSRDDSDLESRPGCFCNTLQVL